MMVTVQQQAQDESITDEERDSVLQRIQDFTDCEADAQKRLESELVVRHTTAAGTVRLGCLCT
jgi:hypothetical protein